MESSSPWLTINNMLIRNKCWICEETFPRGKVKKVFTVDQVLQAFDGMTKSNRGSEFQSPNIKRCLETYQLLGGADAVLEDMKIHDVAPWMSGLACCRNELCARDFSLLLPDASPITAPRSIFPTEPSKDCPPDCGCDNPWPFLSK